MSLLEEGLIDLLDWVLTIGGAAVFFLGLYNMERIKPKRKLFEGAERSFLRLGMGTIIFYGIAVFFISWIVSAVLGIYIPKPMPSILIAGILAVIFGFDAYQAIFFHTTTYPEGNLFKILKASSFNDVGAAESLARAMQEVVASMVTSPSTTELPWKIRQRVSRLDEIKEALSLEKKRIAKKEKNEVRKKISPAPTEQDLERSKEVEIFTKESATILDDVMFVVRKNQSDT